MVDYSDLQSTSKKSKIQNNNLASVILEGLMPITTEAEPLDVDDDAPSRVWLLLSPCQQIFISFLVCIKNY